MIDRSNKLPPASPPHETTGFIFYTASSSTKGEVYYNKETVSILDRLQTGLKKKPISFSDIIRLCTRWGKVPKGNGRTETVRTMIPIRGSGETVVDLLQSGQRQYIVRKIVLSDPVASSAKRNEDIGSALLFVIERFQSERVNLGQIARQWKLNRRETDMVKLLLADQSNKEIAATLKLSLNTIKVYLKLLMRRLGVSSRAGIVAHLLTK